MATIELLNPQTHQHLGYSIAADQQLQASQNSVMVFANELTQLALYYPIVIQKNPQDGRFCLVALLGQAKDENLFMQDQQWQTPQIPLALSRGPFALTFRQSTEGNTGNSPLIGVDVDSPALQNINEEKSQRRDVIPLFEADQPTAFIEDTKQKLQAIHQGLSATERLLEKFNQLGLIEAVNINIQLDDEQQFQMQGNYSVKEEKLNELSAAEVKQLQSSGELKLAYLLIGSLSHIGTLIHLKNAKLKA